MQYAAIPWWRGARGEWYVLGQVALLAIVFFAPRTLAFLPAWPAAIASVAAIAGIVLMAAGGLFLLTAILCLGGRNITPLPCPRESSQLVRTGAYRIVRHPMYAGGILLGYGFALFVHGWLTLLYAIALHVFASIKADREERWLTARYADYTDYQRCTAKLIPFLR